MTRVSIASALVEAEQPTETGVLLPEPDDLFGQSP